MPRFSNAKQEFATGNQKNDARATGHGKSIAEAILVPLLSLFLFRIPPNPANQTPPQKGIFTDGNEA
jgi:hypothetical protein